jgi:hypothetical protein
MVRAIGPKVSEWWRWSRSAAKFPWAREPVILLMIVRRTGRRTLEVVVPNQVNREKIIIFSRSGRLVDGGKIIRTGKLSIFETFEGRRPLWTVRSRTSFVP